MQFVRNGPDIPEELLEEHEEGRVVFFCGAGISYPASLPGFEGLTKYIYDKLNIDPDTIEKTAGKNGQYDTALGLLERRVVGGRPAVRKALAKALKPDLGKSKATQTHEALLELSKNKIGYTRLVTTNFDRIFEQVKVAKSLNIKTCSAPTLPVPKQRWNGLVYLHGLLPENPQGEELNHLVVTSGDFGLAYLTEGWAARFVTELFRNYTVCFVGYSINDPILRYMMDALAADDLMGEDAHRTYAFAEFAKGKEKSIAEEWQAKNITPILYKRHSKHFYLHETLGKWANQFRDGINGKIAIVNRFAQTKPVQSTKQDDFAGRMLWALSDKTGKPAKLFADHDPLPPLDWLEVFSENRFSHKDLPHFGVQPNKTNNAGLKYSLLARPSPYLLSDFMSLVSADSSLGEFDNVMRELALWLAKHINNPELLFWVIRQGGTLHPKFRKFLEQKLEDLSSDQMQILWELLFSGKVKSTSFNDELDAFTVRFSRTGISPASIFALRKALMPVVVISPPYLLPDMDASESSIASDEGSQKISDLVRSEIALRSDHPHSTMQNLSHNEEWKRSLPDLLPYFTALLREALDLMCELGDADDKSDNSYIAQPSISPHEQNNNYADWTVLIDLVRDAWIVAAEDDPEAAMAEVWRWRRIPYPLFKRLAFFAATQRPDLIDAGKALTWLLSDDYWWLWSICTRRETIRLIVSLSPRMSSEQSDVLQNAIVKGPPRSMFRDDLKPETVADTIDHMQWLLFAKTKAAGSTLNAEAARLFANLCKKHSRWQLADDESDEFAIWFSSFSQSDRELKRAPRKLEELMEWLQMPLPSHQYMETDDWQELCVKKFRLAALALVKLSREYKWPVERWRQALHAWLADKELTARSWKCLASTLNTMPPEGMKSAAWALAQLLGAVAKSVSADNEMFFALSKKIVEAYRHDEIDVEDRAMSHAINHPVGITTEAIMKWWFKQNLEDNQGLKCEIVPFLDEACNSDNQGLIDARVILAGNVIPLFRVDPAWTREHLLPFFEWEHSQDMAAGMWTGFLYGARIYWPLLDELKAAFLQVPNHFEAIEDRLTSQYLTMMTYAALEPGGTFKRSNFKPVMDNLPTDKLVVVAHAMHRALQGAGANRSEYFQNRIVPFFKALWPKTNDKKTMEISEQFSLICIASGDAFPTAYQMLRSWMQPLESVNTIVSESHKNDIVKKYPKITLDFLDSNIGENVRFFGKDSELKDILDAIKTARPEMEESEQFRMLYNFLRHRGGN